MWFRRPLSGEQESPTYLWLCAVWPLLVLRPSKKTRCKILLVQVGTLSSSPIPRLGCVCFLSFFLSHNNTTGHGRASTGALGSG